MLRALPFLLLISEALSGTVQLLPALPPATFVNAIGVDSSGYIYIAGEFYPGVPSSSTGHAFVGKLSPDGSQVVWWSKLAGSSNDNAQAIALGSDNSVYVTGTTQSQDFPTTNGIPAKGGAMVATGATVADGMLFVNSGGSGMAGNVLLAFSVQ